MKKLKKILSNSFLWLVMLFFYLPIFYVILFSFNESKSLTKFSGFSLQWYQKMFESRSVREAIYYTLIIAVLATVISTIVGTLTAIGLSKSNKVLKAVVLQINDIPMMNPDIVTAIGFMLLFSSLGVQKGFITILLAHVSFCIPYVILSVMPRLRQLDDNLAEAALDLGATPFQALTKAIIPQLKGSIISGALIAFTMSFDDFVISFFTSGPKVSNIAIYVYSAVKRINPTINALSTVIVVIVTLTLTIVNVVPIIKERKKRGIS
ncbi:MAG: ABC transporter permease, partial [Erysipelotrichaceae bacterium]|nr:ABC transporter permease [Erysipelotrichaceae bacterium]